MRNFPLRKNPRTESPPPPCMFQPLFHGPGGSFKRRPRHALEENLRKDPPPPFGSCALYIRPALNLLDLHKIVEHPNQEGDTCAMCKNYWTDGQ